MIKIQKYSQKGESIYKFETPLNINIDKYSIDISKPNCVKITFDSPIVYLENETKDQINSKILNLLWQKIKNEANRLNGTKNQLQVIQSQYTEKEIDKYCAAIENINKQLEQEYQLSLTKI